MLFNDLFTQKPKLVQVQNIKLYFPPHWYRGNLIHSKSIYSLLNQSRSLAEYLILFLFSFLRTELPVENFYP